MRFFTIYRPAKTNTSPPTAEGMERMNAFIQKSFESGELLATGGLLPGRTYVRSEAGKVTITDGPFAEAKELIAGFALLQGKTKEDGIDMAKRFLAVAGDGECEIHVVMDEPPAPKKG